MKDFLKKLGLGESYVSLALGIIVVVIIGILLIAFVRQRTGKPGQPSLFPAQVEQGEETQQKVPTKHTVAPNENLWEIAVKYYNNGYAWAELAKANNLTNPNLLFVGSELEIPALETKPEIQKVDRIEGNSYSVVRDDNLWMIAVRAYGDGFKWVEIAKANNLTNPNLIHPGNVLKLPR